MGSEECGLWSGLTTDDLANMVKAKAILALVNESVRATYHRHLGLAYQLIDDLNAFESSMDIGGVQGDTSFEQVCVCPVICTVAGVCVPCRVCCRVWLSFALLLFVACHFTTPQYYSSKHHIELQGLLRLSNSTQGLLHSHPLLPLLQTAERDRGACAIREQAVPRSRRGDRKAMQRRRRHG